MEVLYYAFVLLVALIALHDWRKAIYLCIVLDAIRDPVRKLSVDQSVVVTIAGVLPWLAVIVGALSKERSRLTFLFQSYPRLRKIPILVVAAMVPGMLLSVLLYASGWKLALIGSVSYLVPMAGVLVGFLFARTEQSVEGLLKVYLIVNSLMMIGGPLEFFGVDMTGLGGIKMDWVRYHAGYTVDLISGFYRSPDIMGLHAANCVMFGITLAQRARGEKRIAWAALALWTAASLLLCGRRKMIGIPVVYFASLLFLGHFFGNRRMTRRWLTFTLAMLVVFLAFVVTTEEEFGEEYASYATTIFTEGPGRANELILGSAISSLHQSGVLGAGLGVATQGSHYAGVQRTYGSRGWQEDGVSRLVVEFGIPGVLLLTIAALRIVRVVLRSLQLLPRSSSLKPLQFAVLACVLGNAASFAISHQQFSGDPVSGIIVLLLFGTCLAIPTWQYSTSYNATPALSHQGMRAWRA